MLQLTRKLRPIHTGPLSPASIYSTYSPIKSEETAAFPGIDIATYVAFALPTLKRPLARKSHGIRQDKKKRKKKHHAPPSMIKYNAGS